MNECRCNQPGEATHQFGDQRWCWASGAAPIPEWVSAGIQESNHVPSKKGILTDRGIAPVAFMNEPPVR